MDLFTLLVLVGLASLGAIVIAALAAAAAYVVFFAILFALAIVAMIAITIVGMIGDYFYDKRMLRGEAPYRLPWRYRWRGWKIGSQLDIYAHKSGGFYDHRVHRFTIMTRLTDRAFGERYGFGRHN